MGRSLSPLKRFLAVLALIGCAAPGWAASWRGAAAVLNLPMARAEKVELVASGLTEGSELRAWVRRLWLEPLASEVRSLALSCRWQRRDDGLICTGRAGWYFRDARSEGAVDVELRNEELALRWRGESARVELIGDREQGSWRIEFSGVPAAPLLHLLAARRPELLFQAGVASGRFDLSLAEPQPRLIGTLRLEGLSFDTTDGSAAAANTTVSAKLALRFAAATEALIEAEVIGGEWLLGPLYLDLGQDRISLAAALRVPAEGTPWLERLAVEEEGVFSLRGFLHWPSGVTWPDGELALRIEDVSRFLDARAASLSALAGFAGLQGEGRAEVWARLRRNGPTDIAIDTHSLSVRDPNGRFALEGLSGSFELAAVPRRSRSQLRAQAAVVFGLRTGPWQADLALSEDRLSLAAPLRFTMLGGRVSLDELSMSRAGGGELEAELALSVADLSLADLAHHFGWPRFPGTVSGRLARSQYRAGRLVSEGALEIAVFGGKVVAHNLALERPFGSLPTLSADLLLEGLDLAQITSVFPLGLIEGRLSGRIEGLRLIDWEPVAFSLHLATERKGRRRISQKAVENLAMLGGGGPVAAIQRGMVGAFSSFAYEELGLSCVLARHVCTMGGIGSVGHGYFILRGRGIPRVDVIGHQREVDWSVLIARLKTAMTAGREVHE